jgi:hypothetical protein
MSQAETIGGYVVHPAASVFPLIEGDEFDGLVDSITRNGIQHPIVVRGSELLDGRNRLRAAEVAIGLGHKVDIPVEEWKDDGRNVAEWIWDTNAMRRQMTDDGIAMASSVIWPMIAQENDARREASKFDTEKAKKARATVGTKTTPPSKRDEKAKQAASTVGQVAAKAGTSMHKARQAIAVQKAIEAGELPPEAATDVMAGKKKLRQVAPKPERPKAEPKHRSMKAMLEDFRDIVAEWMNADHSVEVLKDELRTHLERIGS